MRPSGHGFIKATIIDEQADLGVEVSGHHFYGVLGGGDDGLLTALVVCRVMVASGESLHQLVAEFPWPAITPDLRIPFSGDSHAVLEAIAGGCGGEVTRLDGVRAQYGGGWALARASITEPAVTLRFEGRDWQRVQEIADRFLAAVPELRAAIPAAALGSPTAAVSSSSLSSAPTNDRGKPTV
jgi:phosphomannomutase